MNKTYTLTSGRTVSSITQEWCWRRRRSYLIITRTTELCDICCFLEFEEFEVS